MTAKILTWNELCEQTIVGKVIEKGPNSYFVCPLNKLTYQNCGVGGLFVMVREKDINGVNEGKAAVEKIKLDSYIAFKIDSSTKPVAVTGRIGQYASPKIATITKVSNAVPEQICERMKQLGMEVENPLLKTTKKVQSTTPSLSSKNQKGSDKVREQEEELTRLKSQLSIVQTDFLNLQQAFEAEKIELKKEKSLLEIKRNQIEEREKLFQANYEREIKQLAESKDEVNLLKKEFDALGGKRIVQLLRTGDEKSFNPKSSPSIRSPNETSLDEVAVCLNQCGLEYEPSMVRRLIFSYFCAIQTGQMIIYAGPPGSGKTSTAMVVPRLLGMNVDLLPVRPGWLDSTDILGYFDPRSRKFEPGPLTECLVNSAESLLDGIFQVVVLDEMNIAKIENYGSDILSRLEKATEHHAESHIYLYSTEEERAITQGFANGTLEDLTILRRAQKYPSRITVPNNLIMTGTMNHDATTYLLSPKVKDRSLFLKFNSTDVKLESKLNLFPESQFSFCLDRFSSTDIPISSETKNMWSTLVNVLKRVTLSELQLSHRTAQVITTIDKFGQIFNTSVGELFDDVVLLKILPWIEGDTSDNQFLKSLATIEEALREIDCTESALAVKFLRENDEGVSSYLK
jgi:hypothetical protein